MARYSLRPNQPADRGKATSIAPSAGNRFKGSQSMRLGKILDMVTLHPELAENFERAILNVPEWGDIPILDMRRNQNTTIPDSQNQACVIIAELEDSDSDLLVGVVVDSFFKC